MDTSVQFFFMLLAAGLILIGVEIFVPGAVLGILGGLCLLGAIMTGFFAFPGLGIYIAVGIVLVTGVALLLWIRFFPGTSFGQRLTVSKDLASSKSSDAPAFLELIGKEGTAISDLRPAGYVLIDRQRMDCMTRGEMISRGTLVKVIHAEGNHVFVAKVQTEGDRDAAA